MREIEGFEHAVEVLRPHWDNFNRHFDRVFNILWQPIIGRYDHPVGQRSGAPAVTASDSSSALGRMPATYRRTAV